MEAVDMQWVAGAVLTFLGSKLTLLISDLTSHLCPCWRSGGCAGGGDPVASLRPGAGAGATLDGYGRHYAVPGAGARATAVRGRGVS
jgi:hypothetical protein